MNSATLDTLPLDPSSATPRARVTTILARHRHLAAILAVGFLVRLALLVACADLPTRIVDEEHYATLASSLLNGHGLAWSEGQLTSLRPPLYPFFIASIWRVVGSESLFAVRVVQLLLGLGMVALTYSLADHLFDRRTALFSALTVCLYPSFLFSGVLILTEVLFSVLLVAAALCYHCLMIRSRVWWAAAVGVLLGLAALTRSVVWPVPFVLAPLVLLTMHRSRTMHGSRHWRAAGAAALLVAGHVAVIAPWAVRNTRLQGTVTIVETMGAENLRMGNYEHTPMDRMWDAISLTGPKHWAADLWIEHPDAIHWTEGQKAQWAQTKAVEYMVQHPGLTVRRSIQKFSDFWGLEREFVAGVQKGLYNPPVWFALAAIAAIGVSYPIVALGAAIGVFRAPPSSRSTHWMILTLAAVMVAIHTVVFGHSRYHLPLVPFLAIYAGAVLAGSLWKGPLFTWRNAGPATAILALLAIWTHEILGRDSGRIRELISPLM